MIISKEFSDGTKVHGIQTGTVSVKEAHYQYHGQGLLRIPQILFSQNWINDLPIWTWVIQTKLGNYVIDTGESTAFYDPYHFTKASDNWVNRRILKIHIQPQQQLNYQLGQIGLTPNQIDAVILTHLHIDHIDGVDYFPQARFLVSRQDLQKPYGFPLSILPSWFKPDQLDYSPYNYFQGVHRLSNQLAVVATPGHTFGHQSVLLEIDGYTLFFAGDTSFTETQLMRNQVGGISVQIAVSKETLQRIRTFSRDTRLIYLPSHDSMSGQRLADLQLTTCTS
jgi:glyoxylase-like metal-dependent hydrolase (beta-lactamase superfamily II)